jgi:benzoyl-CoA reductase/2-hydroxyglutaryl-CoA dehydratase subunit BcrC/BadD/HgdB
MSAFDTFAHFLPFNTLKGEPEAVAYYRELKAELVERVVHRIVPMVAEEKYRLYWDNLPIFFKIAEHTQKFASYGAVPVVAQFPFYFGGPELDPERPLKSIVELLLLGPLNKGVKGRIEFITKLVEGYSIDGLVMQRSRTCQLVNMGQDDIVKALIQKTGLPAVVIEGDVCDPRLYSESEFNSKIDTFMKMLARRGPRGG